MPMSEMPSGEKPDPSWDAKTGAKELN